MSANQIRANVTDRDCREERKFSLGIVGLVNLVLDRFICGRAARYISGLVCAQRLHTRRAHYQPLIVSAVLIANEDCFHRDGQ